MENRYWIFGGCSVPATSGGSIEAEIIILPPLAREEKLINISKFADSGTALLEFGKN